jgi:peptide/nickel transport system ATP-binding protein
MAKEDFKFYRINSQYIPQDPYASINPFKKVRDILMDIVAYHKLAKGEKERLELVRDIMTKVVLSPPEKYLDKYPFQFTSSIYKCPYICYTSSKPKG